MAAKKCLICNNSFIGRADAKTCSPRCRKRLQLLREQLLQPAYSVPLAVHTPQKVERSAGKSKVIKGLSILAVLITGSIGLIFSANHPPAHAATSSTLNFSARLLDDSGAVVPDGTYNIEFKLYDSVSSGGSAQGACSLDSSTDDCWWIETRQNSNSQGVRVVNGYFNVNLGSVTGFGANIPWDQQLWLTMDIGGTSSSPTPSYDGEMLSSGNRIALTGVPYSFTAGALQSTSGANTGTLVLDNFGQDSVITIPDPGGSTDIVCLQGLSNCNGTASTLQATYDAGASQADQTLNLTAAAGGGIILKDDSSTVGNLLTIQNNGATKNYLNVTASGTTIRPETDGNALVVQNAAGTGVLTIDTTSSGTITLGANTTLSASKSLTITGGNTASRPGSPTEGMVYYDTDTKKLITYSNGKWQQDRTDAILVAASNSSQADKDAADYIADGNTGAANDGDQIQINSALTAASGKKVVLLAGTYVVDASISIPNNTTIAGVGSGTDIEAADLDADINVITNTDTTTGTGVVVRDLRLDGRLDLNTTGVQQGIYFDHMGSGSGSSAVPGAEINNLYVTRFRNNGILLYSSNNNVVSDITTTNNYFGISTYLSSYNTITGNVTQGGTFYGISIGNFSTYNTVTGNTSEGNAVSGIDVDGNYTTVSGNTIRGGNNYGMNVNSDHNSISGNRITDSGSTNTNNAIYIAGGDYNLFSNNYITDSSCTTSCYAINIASGIKNQLEGNRYYGSAANAASINDAGTNTIYSNQQTNLSTSTNGDVTSFLYRGSANSASAFQIQNASGNNNLLLAGTINTNLVGNSSAETDATGWAINTGSGTAPASSSTYKLYGNASLAINTSATANAGAKYNTATLLSNSTTYYLSFWAKIASGSFTVEAGRADDDTFAGETACTLNQTTVNTTWQRYTCSFTAGTVTTGGYIFIRQSDSTSRTWYVDGVQLETGAQTVYSEGSLQFNGKITSPTIFQNQSDTSTAFQIQNAAGTTLFNVDTTGGGAITVNADVKPGTDDTINLGDDTHRFANLYLGGETLHIGTSTTDEGALSYTTSSNLLTLANNASSSNSGVLVKNAADSGSAFSVQNAAGTNIFRVDSSSKYVGINSAAPNSALDVVATSADFTDGFESGDISPFTSSSTGGQDVFHGISTDKHSGTYSAFANTNNSGGGHSYLNLTRTLSTTGSISFWCKGYIETPGFGVQHIWFFIDGVQQGGNDCNTSTWTQFSYALTPGTHTFQWDLQGGFNDDGYVWYDDIVVTNASASSRAATFNGGSVGIGTYFPNHTLDVVGDASIKVSTDSTTAFQLQNAAGTNILAADSTNMQVSLQSNLILKDLDPLTNPSGMNVKFYNGTSFGGAPLSDSTMQTINWTNYSVNGQTTNFSTRVTGYIKPLYSETYTFYSTSDDGQRLWVNGSQIINDWNGHGMTEVSGTIALTAGQWYPITLEHYQGSGGEGLKFEWQSASQARELVGTTSGTVVTTLTSSAAAGSNQGGSLSGSSSTTYYYKVTAMSGSGESLPSSEVFINGASFTAISAPASALTSVDSGSAGNVSCDGTNGCKYQVTYSTANGQTTVGPTSTALLNVTSKIINLTSIPTGPTGTTARKIYRSTNGGAYALAVTINDNTTTSTTDNVAAPSGAAPASNTATTNTNNATISWTAVTGATGYRIYRGTSSGGESAYQTSTTSPFTDTGAAGTAGSVPTHSSVGQIGIGTTSPSANLDVRGTVLFKNQQNSTSAFQIQNAAGNSIFSADTQNDRICLDASTTTGNCLSTSGNNNLLTGANFTAQSGNTQQVTAGNVAGGSAGLAFGSSADALLYRTGAGQLLVKPTAGNDSSAAFRVQDASGTDVFTVNSTNRYIGVNNSGPNASLDVVGSSATFMDGFESGQLDPFTASGISVISSDKHSGVYSAKGATVSSETNLYLTQTLSAPGTISFWCKGNMPEPIWVSFGYSYSKFYIDGVLQNTNGCNIGTWTQFSYAVSSGTHSFRWQLHAWDSSNKEHDQWYDDIVVTNAGQARAATFNGGTVGIGTYFPNHTLDVVGDASFKVSTDSATAFQIQSAAGTGLFTADSSNMKVTIGQSNLLLTDISSPTSPGVAAGSNQGGSLSGSSGTTYYYKVVAMSGSGESLPSSEVSINGASFTPITAPGAPTVGAPAGGGSVDLGLHRYKVTFVTANGETTGGTASSQVNVTTGGTQTVPLTAIPVGATGTTARKIYRTVAGDTGSYLLVGTVADNTTTTYNDTTADASLGAAAPVSNTATTNTNNATISWTAVTGATGYRIYRGTSSGGESAYQTSTTSPFTDTGAAGTAASAPTRSSVAQVGIGTNAPTANLDVRGTALFKNAADSTAAFQIQNAAGTSNLFVADTANSRIGIGTSAPTDLFSVSPVYYNTGTASQSGTTITGSGTTWTSDMVGMEFVFADGTKRTITGFGSTTSLTVGTSGTVSSQSYRIHNRAFYVTSDGNAALRSSTNSTTAFMLQDASGTSLLTADTSNKTIKIAGTASTFALLLLDNTHVKSIQTTAPTISAGPTACGSGSPAAAVTSGSTDSAGSFTITTGSGSPTTCDTTIQFNKAYGAAPKSIILTPSDSVNSATAAIVANVSTVSAGPPTTFVVKIVGTPAASTTYGWYYWIVE